MRFIFVFVGFFSGCSESEKDTASESVSTEVFVPTEGDWDLLVRPGENDCDFSDDELSVAVLTTTTGGFTFLVDKDATEDDTVPSFSCALSDTAFACDEYRFQQSQGSNTFTQVINFSGSFTDENTMTGEADFSMSSGGQNCSGIMNLSATALQ